MSLSDVNSREDGDVLGVDALCHFIGNYVGETYDIRAINRWTSSNKGETFLDMMTVDDVAYCVVLLRNHKGVWARDIMKARSY